MQASALGFETLSHIAGLRRVFLQGWIAAALPAGPSGLHRTGETGSELSSPAGARLSPGQSCRGWGTVVELGVPASQGSWAPICQAGTERAPPHGAGQGAGFPNSPRWRLGANPAAVRAAVHAQAEQAPARQRFESHGHTAGRAAEQLPGAAGASPGVSNPPGIPIVPGGPHPAAPTLGTRPALGSLLWFNLLLFLCFFFFGGSDLFAPDI